MEQRELASSCTRGGEGWELFMELGKAAQGSGGVPSLQGFKNVALGDTVVALAVLGMAGLKDPEVFSNLTEFVL